jgi:hypothetical protein
MVASRLDDPLTADELRQRLDYDPKSGLFWWKERPGNNWWNSTFAGGPAGWLSGRGYIYINVHRRSYRAHRLAWLWMTGEWPTEEIDHIDGDPLNNTWKNLRQATRNENSRNRHVQANNITTGIRGITYSSRRSQWIVRVMADKHSHFGGWFNDLESAKLARNTLVRRLHGAFARTD